MNKKKALTKTAAAAMACCMLGSTVFSGAGISTVRAEAEGDSDWNEIQSIVSQYYGEWNDTMYPGQISSYTPDTALMGNGDIGVNSGGDSETKTFYISKGDFWEYNGSQKAIGGYSIKEKEVPRENPNIAPRYKAVTSTAEDTWGLSSLGKAVAVSGKIQNVETGYGWVSQPIKNNEPQWLQLEYESPVTVKKYVIYHDGAIRPAEAKCNSQDFQLQYSDTGEAGDWKVADDVTGNSESIYTKVLENAVTARFFRVYITNPVQPNFDSGDQRAKIAQWELYEKADDEQEGQASDNYALNKPIKVSSEYTHPTLGVQSGAMMIDGEPSTKWCAVADEPHWAIIDLGEIKDIGYYSLSHAGTVGEAEHNTVDYQLQYLETADEDWDTIENNTSWVDMDAVTGNTATVTEKVFETPVQARYIRLFITKAASGNTAARIHELELYAEKPDKPVFYEKQDILNAEVTTEMPYKDKTVSMETFTSATKNVIVTKLTSHASDVMELQAELWGKNGDGNRPVSASVNEDGTVTVTRSTYNGNKADAKSYTSKAAMSMAVAGAETTADASADKGILSFAIAPEQPVYIVTSVGGGGKTYNGQDDLQGTDPVQEAAELLDSIGSDADIEALKAEHQQWWKDFWSASYVSLDATDARMDTIMKYYYGAQYILGCSSREGELAPGIMGIWCNTDSPMWNGHYQLNYNYNAPFYGTNSSNRPEIGLPAFEQVLEYMDEGKKNSESTKELLRLSNEGSGRGNGYVQKLIEDGRIDPENGIKGGLFYPVGITPWGQTVCPGLYHNETLCAAYSAYPGAEYYKYTMDKEYLQSGLYDYLKGCATFYETWLEKDENGQYNMYAGYHENSWGYNPAVELATVYFLFETIVDASEALDVDEDKRELWTDIRDHLAPQPTAEYNGKTVYALAEKGWNGSGYVPLANPIPADGNCIPLESLTQGGRLGYFSTPEELETAQNTIDVFGNGGWGQANNFPRIFTAALRARYNLDTVVNGFANTITANMKPNLRIWDPYHGIEKSGATESVNSMMMQTDKGITKIFPSWYADKNAKFSKLRAEGAFIVSAEYDGTAQEAKNVVITSEKGETMTLAAPWSEGAAVRDSAGNVVKTEAGTAPNWEEEKTITFDTKAGETYTVEKGQAPVDPELDYTEIDEAISEAEAIKQDGYTQESYHALQDALKNARDARQNAAAQDELNQKKDELRAAIDGLRGSKTVLETFLSRAKKHVENGDVDGLVESVQILFAEAIAEGETIMEKEDATKEDVLGASAKLMKAIQALDMKAGDKADLGMALELTNMIDLTKYVEAGQAEYLAAKEEAEGVLDNGDAMQPEVDAAWTTLVDTIMNLRLKADKAALSDFLESVKDLDLNKYTEKSVRIYNEALALANTIMNDDDLSVDDQAKVDEAVVTLMAAKDGLTEKKGSGGGDNNDPNGNGGQNNNGQKPNGNDQNGNNQNGNSQNGNGTQNKGSANQGIKTGDAARVFVPIIGLMLSFGAAAAAGVVFIRRKRK